MYKSIASIALIALMAGIISPVAYANDHEEENEKVTICHRTNAPNNPYNQIDISEVSADEDKPDHTDHEGPVPTTEAEAEAFKAAKTKWGDIIPPHDGFPDGLNWTAQGQAIYNNGCNYVTPGMGGGNPTPPAPVIPSGSASPAPKTPQVTPPTQGQGVNAGGGAVAPVLALLSSVAAFSYGVLRFRKLNI